MHKSPYVVCLLGSMRLARADVAVPPRIHYIRPDAFYAKILPGPTGSLIILKEHLVLWVTRNLLGYK